MLPDSGMMCAVEDLAVTLASGDKGDEMRMDKDSMHGPM